MRALLLLLCLGCAGAKTAAVADAAEDEVPDAPTARAPDGAPKGMSGIDGSAAAPDGPTIIPPSQRDGGIPPVPPGAPPCAPDSNAGDGKACHYQAPVDCTPPSDGGPIQVCTCLPVSLGGKWYCMAAPDGGPRPL